MEYVNEYAYADRASEVKWYYLLEWATTRTKKKSTVQLML